MPTPLPTVVVETVQRTSVGNRVELPGRIEATKTAEVRARVDGIVEQRLYQEGTDVAAGTPLFRIDSRDYDAALVQAKAALSRANAARENAASVVERFRPLVARQAVSALEFEAADTTLQQAQANVNDARAAVALAQLRVERCVVRAPIAGRVGRALVTEGALVSAGAATLLTQINQLSPINAVFSQSSVSLLDLQKAVREGAVTASNGKRIEVHLLLANGEQFGEAGYLDFTDLSVDPSTGTQVLRARFRNADRVLLPGQFVRAQFAMGSLQNAIILPERALQFEQQSTSVSIVTTNGTVARRNVTLGQHEVGAWVVTSGLAPGEQLIVDGWQRVQPGQQVKAESAPQPKTGS